jgi:hypothetical protein
MGLIAQMFVAYAVSYAVTYIATGSAKAAQGAGQSSQTYSLNVLMSQGKSRVNLIRNQHQKYRPFSVVNSQTGRRRGRLGICLMIPLII